jgi:hypothetical protein
MTHDLDAFAVRYATKEERTRYFEIRKRQAKYDGSIDSVADLPSASVPILEKRPVASGQKSSSSRCPTTGRDSSSLLSPAGMGCDLSAITGCTSKR